MNKELIQGIECEYRKLEFGENVLYENLPQEEQYFRKTEIPFTDADLEALVEKTHQYTSDQATWKEREEWRFDNGVYARINGILRFIPGSYYCYVNYWHLEDGEIPDYREDERQFALFLEHCDFRTPLYGVTRPKGRRQGATSFGSFFEWFIAGRKEFKNVGTISFNDDAAQDVFVNMIMPGFKSLLPCFQADFDSPDDGKSFLRFVKPVDRKKKGSLAIKRTGLNSYIDYKPTTINAYTNKRLSFILIDEFGRWDKLDCNLYWSKVSKALRKGKKKLGFAYLPTVVNPENKGGGNYRKFYKNSDQRRYGMNTPTNCVIFIVYGTQCYAGCIDKFGNSVIDDPVEPIMGNDGEMITEGSKTLILRERSLLEGNELMEHRRDFPIDEYDIFAFETGDCEFNEQNIRNQILELDENPAYIRQVRLGITKETIKSIVIGKPDKDKQVVNFMDDAKGGWFLLEEPNLPNHFSNRGGFLEPLNSHLYSIGVDTTQDRVAIDGSNPCIIVFKKSCIVEGEETGLYPVAIWISPTRLDIHFDEEVKKACMWYGCKANYELDRRTDFYRYFCKEQCQSFLEWTPKVAQNPLKHKNLEYGTRSGDPFQLAAQLQVCKMYIDGTDNDVFNGHVHRIKFPSLLNELLRYDHLNRTKSDQVIALMMALLPIVGETEKPVIPYEYKKLLPQYKIKMVS